MKMSKIKTRNSLNRITQPRGVLISNHFQKNLFLNAGVTNYLLGVVLGSCLMLYPPVPVY